METLSQKIKKEWRPSSVWRAWVHSPVLQKKPIKKSTQDKTDTPSKQNREIPFGWPSSPGYAAVSVSTLLGECWVGSLYSQCSVLWVHFPSHCACVLSASWELTFCLGWWLCTWEHVREPISLKPDLFYSKKKIFKFILIQFLVYPPCYFCTTYFSDVLLNNIYSGNKLSGPLVF